MLENLRRFNALERPAQKLFLQALAGLPLVSLTLKWRGFTKTRAALQKIASTADSPLAPDFAKQRAALTSRLVNSADRHGVVHPSCLAKSLTLWWLLGRQGIASELRIGIRKEKDKFEAHAWVERDGIPLNEPEQAHRHYSAFDAAFASWPEGESREV